MTATDARILKSRRDFLSVAAAGLALTLANSGQAAAQSSSLEPPASSKVPFVEHEIEHDGHKVYVREYPGEDPAYVMMHGFPDNLHIYDYVVPLLTQAGRRVVVFDFLGFGKSEKIDSATYRYTFAQQVGDLAAVADALKLDKFIPVGHDAGGPVAINYSIDHPERVAWLCLMNCYYADSPTLRLPEIIEVFGDPWLKDLAQTFLETPEMMNWLLAFQDNHFQAKMPPALRERFTGILRPIVRDNFANGAGPAFRQMTSQVRENVAYNTSRLPDVHKFAPKVRLIWGTQDPYLTPEAADAIAANFPHASVKSVEAGHWLIIDKPEEVARHLLADA
ncbi:alpha/beta hydrolase [Rhizobium calliandrae]|uniref:Alpha/beta hydrolase n=1 Tax=Rhizobium calliandrae TaxID=1312182 RepID=A0ABT7KDY7_9HYPH|nr:alpha/beta hydrolase [Rhizobium calliandrae]MDL2406846.1 alpha/beta hydrolase [Rhizobium calliandrae]